MTEKKEVKSAPKAAKKASVEKALTKKSVVAINAKSIGFKADDVYNALAAEAKALTAAEIAKVANTSTDETYLDIGWFFKEDKVKGENDKAAPV